MWLQVSAGQGPAECAWAAARVAEAIEREARAAGLAVSVLDAEPGPVPGTAASVLLDLPDGAPPGWVGTIAWIGESPFRPGHKRKNWFVGVTALEPPPDTAFAAADVRVEVMPPGGPGGQHANKTASAVRITHVPTGIAVVAREARSQGRNRKLALARLQARLAEQAEDARSRLAATGRQLHLAVVRGEPVRVYEGPAFRRKR